MNVSAINCTPIKPQVAFGQTDEDEQLQKYMTVADEIDDEFVKSANIKKPVAAVISVALAGLIAFASGKRIAQLTSLAAEKLKVDLPKKLDNSLRKISEKAVQAAKNLSRENPITKSEKLKNLASNTISNVEKHAKTIYKKIAYSGIAKDATAAVRQSKAFANVGGALGVLTVLPTIAAKDSDKDGVSDIMQRGQNAYTGAKTKMSQLMEQAGKVSEIVDMLT